jgi:predicted MFS family arabinose efflux permease
MALGIFGIVGAEFLPASLLTPIADNLSITEGMAGQSITVTAAVAFVTSLVIAAFTNRVDRRYVLAVLTLLLVLSNLMVAMASDYTALLLARVLLGISLGGFWSLSPATMMRLVPPTDIPKALAILFGGVSAATVFAAPFASFFGALWGWRTVFAGAAGLGAIALVVQLITLPSMRSSGAARIGTLFTLLGRPKVGLGLLAVLLVFCGHFTFFSYLRPFLETVTALDPFGITVILLVYGVGTFVGNSVAGLLIRTSLRATTLLMPLLMAVMAILLPVFGGTGAGAALLVGLWGAAFGVVPVAWSTWITQTMPDEAEGKAAACWLRQQTLPSPSPPASAA